MKTFVVPALQLLMSAGLFLALFGKSVGLPPWTEKAGLIFGVVCALIGLVIQRLTKQKSALANASPEQRLRRRWLFITLGAIATLSAPFWLPEADITLPFRYRLLVSVISFAFVTTIVMIATRNNRPQV